MNKKIIELFDEKTEGVGR